jgi:hypothetical protein
MPSHNGLFLEGRDVLLAIASQAAGGGPAFLVCFQTFPFAIFF